MNTHRSGGPIPDLTPPPVRAMTTALIRRIAVPLAVATTLLFAGRPFAAEAVAQCGVQGVAVQVLGSGGPEMRGRASASYLVWVDGRARVLLDSGGGSALRFGESGARMADIDVVLFSHLHSDHSADFPVLVKSSHFEPRPRRRALPVFGPTGTALFPTTSEFLAGFFAAKTGVFRYLGPAGNEMVYDLEPHDVALSAQESRGIYDQDGLRVSATAVIHANVPALAFLVEAKGKKIAFSGDGNGNNGNLQKLAAGADMLVAHLAIDDSFHFGERSLHAPPALIGEIAADARVGQLVLAHRRPETLGKEAALQAVIARAYKGSIVFAEDLSCFGLN